MDFQPSNSESLRHNYWAHGRVRAKFGAITLGMIWYDRKHTKG